MNKLVIFDLDGVLLNSKDIHFDALNQAIAEVGTEFVISRDDHLKTFDGLPTAKKLSILTETRGLPAASHEQIWLSKQRLTEQLFTEKLGVDYELVHYFDQLKKQNFQIAVASNSVRNTVKTALLKFGLLGFVDYYVSNQDVSKNKPFPEMYWKCMIACEALPDDTVILEDSHIGQLGARNSKALLIPVENRAGLNQEMIERVIGILSKSQSQSGRWKSESLNVLIPMAGTGSRFAAAGYTFPKPLIEVNGKPMIQVVFENLNIEANYTFVVLREHCEKYNLNYLLKLIAPDCNIVQIDGMTEGAACSTLLAKDYINTDAPLLIANCDQYVEWNSSECLYALNDRSLDGGMITFKATHPKWSYAKLDEQGIVTEVAERKPISDNATVGIYYWKKGCDYVNYAEQMIAKNIRTNDEFYVCPVYNEAIADNKKFKAVRIEKMWGIGTPEDLSAFLEGHRV